MDIMLLDNKRKFLFIHIPKTAGTSIRNNLATLTDLEKPYSELNKELKHKSGILLKDLNKSISILSSSKTKSS